MGTCAHIASVIWYLSFARHINAKFVPNKKWIDSVSDAANIPEIVDESESDSEVTGE